MVENRIFVIGFPKCGTSSINNALISKGVPSIHWALDPDRLVLLVGLSIEKAKKEGKPLLSYLKNYRALTQMETCIDEHRCYWPQLLDVPTLDSQYPKSKFIFNDRDIYKWVNSVSKWRIPSHGSLRERLIKANIPGLPKGKGSNDSELIDWYIWHKNNMIDYFKNKDNFIVFNIEEDKSEKLGEFLGINNLVVPHSNRSVKNDAVQK
jgi:protein O-GlcNAc transferase